MKMAPARRRPARQSGVGGVARLDRRTTRLAGRLHPGDIAIIDHVDLDRVAAEALVAARPAMVINIQPSISGRYPNLGPEVIVANGIPLLDDAGAELFAAVKEGTKIVVEDDVVFVGDTEVARGRVQSVGTVAARMAEARRGLSAQLEAFAVNTSDFMGRERELVLDGIGLPELSTRIAGRHVVVVVRGFDHEKELKALKHYIHEYRPVLIGVDGGADTLMQAGHRPHVIVGDMDAVSEQALQSGAEVIVRAHPDGRAPGLLRVQDLNVPAVAVPSSATSEDLAFLLADGHGAQLIVAVGSHATLTEFLDKGRTGMASSFLVRLRVGAKLVDAHGVLRLYRNRISAAALLLLVIAALVAVVAVLAVSDTGRGYLSEIGHQLDHAVHWIEGLFS